MIDAIAPHRDAAHPHNSHIHHTGKECIEKGCLRAAGTAWSPFWCFPCNADRMDRISASLDEMLKRLGAQEGPTP